MTYEEYLIEFEPIMINMCKKFNGLNMEYEDRMQECYLLLFAKLDKLEEKENMQYKRAYFKTCLDGHFGNINIKEHEQGLRNTISYNSKQDGFDDEKLDILISNDIEQKIIDPFLERIYQARKDNLKRWRKNNIEHCREYDRKYREEHKEQIREYNRKWYKKNRAAITLKRANMSEEQKEKIKEYKHDYYINRILEYKKYKKNYYKEHKEEIQKQHKKYNEEHKEEIKEYKKKYYQEHKEEINKKRKEKRQLEKEQKKNGQ